MMAWGVTFSVTASSPFTSVSVSILDEAEAGFPLARALLGLGRDVEGTIFTGLAV